MAEQKPQLDLSTKTEAERRRSPRLRVRVPVLLRWEDTSGKHSEHTHTVTLSWHGCSVFSHHHFRPGSQVHLERENASRQARVVYSLKDFSTNLVEVGICFDADARDFWPANTWVE